MPSFWKLIWSEMNNPVVVVSDSSCEDAEPSRQDRTESASRWDASRRSYTSSESSSDDLSEDLNKNDADFWSICLQYFDHNTSCLPWGHLFHHHCICTMDGQLRVGECPLWKRTLGPFEGATRLFFYPNGLGSEMADNLMRSIRRLVKQNRKLVSKHKAIKEELEEKCRHIFALKTLIRQLEANEKEIFNGKEVDLLTKEKYSEGIIHTCCKSYECQHARKILRAVRYLGRGPRFAENCQRIISAANNKFIRHAVRDWGEAVNGHNFNTYLPFWI